MLLGYAMPAEKPLCLASYSYCCKVWQSIQLPEVYIVINSSNAVCIDSCEKNPFLLQCSAEDYTMWVFFRCFQVFFLLELCFLTLTAALQQVSCTCSLTCPLYGVCDQLVSIPDLCAPSPTVLFIACFLKKEFPKAASAWRGALSQSRSPVLSPAYHSAFLSTADGLAWSTVLMQNDRLQSLPPWHWLLCVYTSFLCIVILQ